MVECSPIYILKDITFENTEKCASDVTRYIKLQNSYVKITHLYKSYLHREKYGQINNIIKVIVLWLVRLHTF